MGVVTDTSRSVTDKSSDHILVKAFDGRTFILCDGRLRLQLGGREVIFDLFFQFVFSHFAAYDYGRVLLA